MRGSHCDKCKNELQEKKKKESRELKTCLEELTKRGGDVSQHQSDLVLNPESNKEKSVCGKRSRKTRKDIIGKHMCQLNKRIQSIRLTQSVRLSNLCIKLLTFFLLFFRLLRPFCFPLLLTTYHDIDKFQSFLRLSWYLHLQPSSF